MGVTVVGVCRYGDRYDRFFHSLKKLGALATIKEMSRVYFNGLSKFLGVDVGFKQDGVLEKTRIFGFYIEHLLLIYWIGATILVLAFRPVEPAAETTNSLLQAAAFVTLLTINIGSDAVSLLWTKRCIALLAVPTVPLTSKKLFWVLAQDILVAIALMIAVQFVSNGLYAFQIGRPEKWREYMFDLCTAFKPYAAVDPTWSTIQFPGQLLITCTTYIPSILFYVISLIILLLKPFHRILVFMLGLLNPDMTDHAETRNPSCTPLGYMGALLGVCGFAVGSASLFVGTWQFIH
jgi:hypothetical protein